MENYQDIFNKQKNFYYSKKTDVEFCKNSLKRLKEAIKKNEYMVIKALNMDLGKSEFEGYITEIGLIYDEIDYAIKNIKRWRKREKVKSPLFTFKGAGYIYKEPYGVVLIIGPFNYPFQLVISPLIGAMAAGNCAIIKPSEHSMETTKALIEIINNNFNEEYLKVLDPSLGKEVVTNLLELRFDYVFFTGSIKVGKVIMEKCSKNLIPITLELGGKSPCIVDKDCDIKLSAKRIVWGKLLNLGQTCIAPDYLIVHSSIKTRFLKALVEEIELQFTDNPITSPDYGKIISKNEANRLSKYLSCGDIYYGGDVNIEERYIKPTILTNIKGDSSILKDEIFGPIFPVLEFTDLDMLIEEINNKEHPLALYYFSNDKEKIEKVINRTISGGVTINDVLMHILSKDLPFGGVGYSGMGTYHGKASFNTFTHNKSVFKRSNIIEFSFRFAPYKNKIKILKKIF